MTNYSVLMSVYYKEDPSFFNTAIQSILSQTHKTDDFVIVCDGKLTKELDEVLKKYESNPIFNIVRLDDNSGLGNALREGMNHCKNEFVLRMDSDDISLPDRAEIQVKELEEGADVIGGYVAEFINNPSAITSIRKVPLTKKEIYKFGKKRSPFNHPCVAYRKSYIEKCGGYSDKKTAQDWDLWVRVILQDGNYKNIDRVLVNMRTNDSIYIRRKGKKYLKSLFDLFSEMYRLHYISFFRMHWNRFVYFINSIAPLWFKKAIYKALRK